MNSIAKINDLTFISQYANLAPDDYCDRMIAKFDELEKSSSAWKGSEANGVGLRKDYSFMFHQAHCQAYDLMVETHKLLDNAIEKYINEHPSLEPMNFYSLAIKVQRTPPKGGFHSWHCEHNFGEAATRMLTWTIYLNDVPDGEGETEFLEYGVKCKPKKGTVAIFPASWTHTHRGNAVYTHDKYIATGWYYIYEQ